MAAKGEAGQPISPHAQSTGWLTVGRRTGSGADPGGRVVDRGSAGQVRIHRLVGAGWVRPATRIAPVFLVGSAPVRPAPSGFRSPGVPHLARRDGGSPIPNEHAGRASPPTGTAVLSRNTTQRLVNRWVPHQPRNGPSPESPAVAAADRAVIADWLGAVGCRRRPG
jgi:hypothetical protein